MPQTRKNMDAELIPDMRRRIVVMIEAARKEILNMGHNAPKWMLMVDDDSYVRVRPMRAVLSVLNHSKALLIGDTLDYPVKPRGIFCQGAATMALSHALLRRWDDRASQKCLDMKALRDVQYGDVFLGHCAKRVLGVTCMDPTVRETNQVRSRWVRERATFHEIRDPLTFTFMHGRLEGSKKDEDWVKRFLHQHQEAANDGG